MSSVRTFKPDPKLDLVFERVVDVPPELVWRAWTEPAHLMKWYTPVPWQTVSDGDLVPAGDDQLTVIHTPGHSPDHLAFWHKPSGTIFSGDLVVRGSSVMIHTSRGGNLSEYLRSLQRLLMLEPAVLLPAHGPRVDDPRALLTGYLEHRRMREQQVLDALRAGRTSVQAIAESIYDGLDPALLPAAHENVRAHLEKLEAQGVVSRQADRWTC